MKCSEIKPLLAARRDLPFGQEREVQLHLATCTACAETWRAEEKALRALHTLPLPPAGATERVAAASDAEWPRGATKGLRHAGRAVSFVMLTTCVVLLPLVLAGLLHGAGGTMTGAAAGQADAIAPAVAAAGATAQPKSAPQATPAVTRANPDQLLDSLMVNFASQLHVDQVKLNTAFVAAASVTVDQAVRQGTLSAEDAQALKQKVESAGLRGWLQRATMEQAKSVDVPQAFDAAIPAAATSLGMSPDQLAQELKRGKSLLTLASERHIDAQRLRAAMLTAVKTKLDQLVPSGKLTQVQVDKQMQAATKEIEALLAGQTEIMSNERDDPQDFNVKAVGLPIIASSLGMSQDQLVQAIENGKPIRTLAADRHVDIARLRASLLSAGRSELDKLVRSGTLTPAQSDKQFKAFNEFADSLIDGTSHK
jgi:ribosome-binding protein aMBF1 (putative translation factor)